MFSLLCKKANIKKSVKHLLLYFQVNHRSTVNYQIIASLQLTAGPSLNAGWIVYLDEFPPVPYKCQV